MSIPERILRKWISIFYKPIKYVGLFYGQEGEDVILKTLMEHLPEDYKGFYVDIGAHHPWRFSNTFIFYQQGWKGINVDATPGSMTPFVKYRKRDINLEIGVGRELGSMEFYCFNEPALNTFDRVLAMERNGKQNYRLVSTQSVGIITLENLFARYLPDHTQIDFLTIDVEGLDFLILQSNDWTKYRPAFILIEESNSSSINENEMANFLSIHGYFKVACTKRTAFYKRNV